MTRAWCAALALVLVAATRAAAWDDVTGERDMPWLAYGDRARLFSDRSTCVMCPTGYTVRRRWGTSGWRGEDPYVTAGRALRFLRDRGVLEAWPVALGEGDVGDGREIIHPRVAPYHLAIVMLSPTVVVMAWDPGALTGLGTTPDEQTIGSPRLAGGVAFGTRVPGTGPLRWFSPDAGQVPVPVTMETPDRGVVRVENVTLVLERRGDAWTVLAPRR